MKIGGLYQLKKYYWLLYPSRDIATAAVVATVVAAAAATVAIAAVNAAYLSKRLNCNVSYIEPSMFVLLEQDKEYCKLLTANGQLGWIIYPEDAEWTKDCIEEVKAE